MQEIDVKDLVSKFKEGNCSPEEQSLLENWYLQWKPKDVEVDAVKLEALMNDVWNALPVHQPSTGKIHKLWWRVAAAASIILVVGISIWFFSLQRHPDRTRQPELASAQDIKPGKNTATLTLANGKTINLSDAKTSVIIDAAKLTYNDGTEVNKPTANNPDLVNKELTISTPRGGQYQVILPDGTKVWLNAASSLIFPKTFAGVNQRKVILSGEAYFEVSKLNTGKNIRIPFIVATKRQRIEVLGTHFNVSAYPDDNTSRTTLLEGKVKVTDGNANSILEPGTQAYSGPDGLHNLTVDANEVVAWKNGRFTYKNTNVDDVMRQIARWYDVEIIYESPELKQNLLSGSVSRYENISGLLKAIEQTGVVKFKINDRKITVTK